ncbi:MBL fold metallo-hydrolase RNA specificity domain-containing protein [Thermoanaerobacterium sp. R66]|uniref:MBL fold metallo-hydrolase RNA specificity domain-containing protein n=1 Tax=Thermoanaerobacterium sp. R66 TaxID=2742479 RepID=UPI00237FE8A9|nr:MBL fold metallo-hydrolase RNA specificity domain-containing protein [Thermoanaerobacterium sp. R66]MDE4542734.1 MBL fold metallo-hydrolase [Thermoanaerobacterium sp. R66]
MKFYFCGGASEVGASCYLVNIDGKNILLDCGIRMSSSKDNLPDFQLIQENGGVDVILISHAHMDHIGALPIISRIYPDAKIYMTHAAKDLTRVLLYDSLKIMEREAEIPAYAEIHVKEMLNRIICHTPGHTFSPFLDSDLKVTFYSAGHIAGAASIYIVGNEGSFFYSGDFSRFRQNAIEGASIPKLRPDVAFFESTYGDKLHANRELEESRLVEKIGSVVKNGGKVLIPAFALGRAQEIILILKKAINKGMISTKVYVDGMVKDICRIYKLNPNYLRETLAKKIFKGGEIFFDDNVMPVDKFEMREEIIKEPCVIVSSSGMLTGGPSQWYAEKLAEDEKNLIAITGYQDEESPGRRLLELTDEKDDDKKLKLADKEIPVKCAVDKFGLSAHADMSEILSLVNFLYPKKVFLIHGDPDTINFLGREIQKDIKTDVYMPQNGDVQEIDIQNPRKQLKRNPYPSMKMEEALNEINIEKLWRFVLDRIGADAALSVEDIGGIWGCIGDTDALKDLLNNSLYFQPDKKMMFLYHAISEEELKSEKDEGPMEVNQMLSLVDEYFSRETGLYKKGARFDEKIAILYFDFPDVAKNKYSDLFKEFEERTGWKVELNENVNTSAINDVIYKLMPNVTINKVSYKGADKLVSVKIDGEIENIEEVKDKFYNETGLKLVINGQDAPVDTIRLVDTGDDKLEQNEALKIIDEVFRDLPHKPYKKSIKTLNGIKYIELSFISKVVGERYKGKIDELIKRTGWQILVGNGCNQIEVINIAKRVFGEMGVKLKKNPSVYLDDMTIGISIDGDADDEIIKKIDDMLYDMTGLRLR